MRLPAGRPAVPRRALTGASRPVSGSGGKRAVFSPGSGVRRGAEAWWR
ncbi:hypothetical protein APASM_5071 [Actinosynnema pretiosum subsp. pretiosum]|nr:hypothetical protein APASM_5071 [Actinosynnema pretiosum subsp. pretiosum]